MSSAHRIQFRIFAVSLCLTVAVAAVSVVYALVRKDKALSLILKGSYECTDILAKDWSGDFKDDLALADRYKGRIDLSTSEKLGLDAFDLDHMDCFAGLFDLDGDGNRKELGISHYVEDDRCWLAFYDLDKNSFSPNPAPLAVIDNFQYARYHGIKLHEDYSGYKPEVWCPHIAIGGQADFNGDGIDDLVITINTGYELIPRGIWIYDGQSLKNDGRNPKIIAFKRLEAEVHRIYIDDILRDPDHRPEILAKTYAMDNWTESSGQLQRIPPDDWPLEKNRIDGNTRIDDRERVYLFGFESGREELTEIKCWESAGDERIHFDAFLGPKTTTGGRFAYIIAKGDADTLSHHRIEKIDCSTPLFTCTGIYRIKGLMEYTATIEPDAANNLLVCCYENGLIELLNADLEVIRSKKSPFGKTRLRPRFIDDVDSDGRDELVAIADNAVHILSLPELAPLGSMGFGGRVVLNCRHLDRGEDASEIIIKLKSNRSEPTQSDMSSYSDYNHYRIRADLRKSLPGWAIPSLSLFSGMTLAAGLGLLLTRRTRRGDENAQQVAHRRDALLETLRSVGHGKIATSTLNQIKMLLDHAGNDPDPAPELLDRLQELAASFRKIVRPQLDRIPPAARTAEIDETTVRSFSEAASVLSQHFGDDGISSPRDWITSAAPITSAIDEIATMRRKMLEEVSGHYVCSPVEIAERMLVAAAPEAARHGVELEPLAARLAPGVRAFGKDSDLIVVLEDLLSNAMHAMKGRNKKRIALFVDTCGDRITVDVADTGPGIPDDLKNRIFERGFSTKQGGGGLGLAQAAEILDKFGGRIFVAETGLDQGTTMRIELRIM